MKFRNAAVIAASTAALTAASFGVIATGTASAAPAGSHSCAVSEPTSFPDNITVQATASVNLHTAPTADDCAVAPVPIGSYLWVSCYTMNQYGDEWYWATIQGKGYSGWISSDSVDYEPANQGPAHRCPGV